MKTLYESNIPLYYDEYLKKFKNAEAYVHRQGGQTRGLSPSSYEEFKLDYISVFEENQNRKVSGKRLAEEMAQAEVYQLSFKQSIAAAKGYKEKYGVSDDVGDIALKLRIGSDEQFFNDIRARREKLRREGKSKADIRDTIGHEFFGSEKRR